MQEHEKTAIKIAVATILLLVFTALWTVGMFAFLSFAMSRDGAGFFTFFSDIVLLCVGGVSIAIYNGAKIE